MPITKAKRRADVATTERPRVIRMAIGELAEARDMLRSCGSKNAADYVARAMKSAEGALRHAERMKYAAPPCPSCHSVLRDSPIENSISRYASGIYVCSGCGTREALEGNFWKPGLRQVQAAAKDQARWIDNRMKDLPNDAEDELAEFTTQP